MYHKYFKSDILLTFIPRQEGSYIPWLLNYTFKCLRKHCTGTWLQQWWVSPRSIKKYADEMSKIIICIVFKQDETNAFHSHSQQWRLLPQHRCFKNITAATVMPQSNMPPLFRWLTDIVSPLPVWIWGLKGGGMRGGWLFVIHRPDGIKHAIRTQAVKRGLDYSLDINHLSKELWKSKWV